MYSPLDARRAAGYIHVKRRDAGVILGQVCAVAVYLPSRLAEDAQRYTLLLETSKHTLEWETSDSEQEAIYELQESRQRLKEEYDIEITMPANAAWNWSSPDTQFEFFDGQNGQNDVVLIAIELAEGQPLPHPTIMPDTNNVVARDWSCGTNLFGSVFRSRGDRKNRQLDITFTGMSVEIEGGLRHQVEAADGDSGGMLYHSAGDSGTLIPVGVITGKWKGPAFSVSQVDVLQKLLGETGKTLEERNTRVIFDDFISALSTRQLPDPMRRLDRPSNTAASRIQGIGETPDEHVQPRLYSRKQALQAAGYIRVKKTDDDESVWSGQVCAVAVFLHSCLAGDTQRYTLLVLTSKHTLEWEPSDSESETESETIYGLEGGSRRLKEEYGIEIIMPANEAWNWSSPDTLFEFFADENDQHDVALIAIELAKDEPLPHPTIMPDINNVVLGDWSHGTNFFGIVFRSGNGGEAEGEEMFPHYVDFKSSSVELGGTLHHQAKTEEGGSGGMLYCYADDPEKLVPACVITVQWIGVDHSHTYSVKQSWCIADSLEDDQANPRRAELAHALLRNKVCFK